MTSHLLLEVVGQLETISALQAIWLDRLVSLAAVALDSVAPSQDLLDFQGCRVPLGASRVNFQDLEVVQALQAPI